MYNREAQKKYRKEKVVSIKVPLRKSVDIEAEIIERFDLINSRGERKKDFFMQMYDAWKKAANIKSYIEKNKEK
jgi:hypothetical protein